jgi:hypothetical protein
MVVDVFDIDGGWAQHLSCYAMGTHPSSRLHGVLMRVASSRWLWFKQVIIDANSSMCLYMVNVGVCTCYSGVPLNTPLPHLHLSDQVPGYSTRTDGCPVKPRSSNMQC